MPVRKIAATGWLGFLLIIAPMKLGNSVSSRFTSLCPTSFWQVILSPWSTSFAPVFAGLALLLALAASPQARLTDLKPYRHIFGVWTTCAAVSFIGWINSDSLDVASSFTGHLIGVAAFSAAIAVHLYYHPRERRTLLVCIVVGIGLLAYQTIYQVHFGFAEVQQYLRARQQYEGYEVSSTLMSNLLQGRAMAYFAISNSLAAHYLVVIPIIVATVWYWCRKVEPPRAAQILFSTVTAAILLYCFYCTKSRAAIAALGIAIGGLFVCQTAARPKTVRQHSAWLLPLLVLLAVGFFPIMRFIQGNRPAWSSVQSRLLYWQAAWQMFTHHPLAGIGLGDFFHAYLSLKPPGAEETRLAHSVFYHFLSQCGILGAVAAVYLLILPLLLWRQQIAGELQARTKYLGYALLLGIMAWSVHSLVDFNIQIPATLFTINALIVIIYIPDSARREPCGSRHKATLVILGALAVAALAQAWKLPGEYAFRQLEQEISDPRSANLKRIYELAKKSTKQLRYSPYPWLRAGSFYQHIGAYGYSMKAHQEACDLAPNSPAAHFRLAKDYFELGYYQESETELRKAFALYPHKEEYLELWRRLQTVPRT